MPLHWLEVGARAVLLHSLQHALCKTDIFGVRVWFFPILSIFMLTFSSGQLQGITRDPPQLSHNNSLEVFGGPAPNPEYGYASE